MDLVNFTSIVVPASNQQVISLTVDIRIMACTFGFFPHFCYTINFVAFAVYLQDKFAKQLSY